MRECNYNYAMIQGNYGYKKGFTVIEVSLVLAIGGLIFLMVFIALPALQRSQRDTRRRDDVMILLEKIKNYEKNNRGALPGSSEVSLNTVNVNWSNALNTTGNETTWRGFYRDYLKDTFVDPSGGNYNLTIVKCGAAATDSDCTNSIAANLENQSFPNGNKMIIVLQATCKGSKTVQSSNPRNLAVMYRLEGAGVYCNSL